VYEIRCLIFLPPRDRRGASNGGARDMTYGEEARWNRLMNAGIVGVCVECGGYVKREWATTRVRVGEYVCLQCGIVNGRWRRLEDLVPAESVIEAMRKAYEQLTSAGIRPEVQPFTRTVEWIVGQSLGRRWVREGQEWFEKAGLKVEDGYVVKEG